MSRSIFSGVALQNPEQWPQPLREDMEQLVASIQHHLMQIADRVSPGQPIVTSDDADAVSAVLNTSSAISGKTLAISEDLAASSGSNLIGFLQSGTGAALRTAQSKMREKRSAADYLSGALTGAAIQAAIDALPTFGGRVELADATYVITAPLVWAGAKAVDLYGQGMFSTILDWQGGNNSAVIRMDSTTALLPYGDRLHDFSIRNSVAATGMTGIQNNTSAVTTNRNLTVIEGVEIWNLATSIVIYNGVDQFVIRRCALTSGTTGITSLNPTAGTLSLLTIEDCIFGGFTAWPIDLVIGGCCRISRNFINGSASFPNGIRIDKFDDVVIEANQMELTNSAGTAIYLGKTAIGGANLSGGRVSANHMNFNTAVAGSKGIVVDYCRGITLDANNFAQVETGIQLTANSINTTILTQNWADTVTVKLVDAGTGTLISLDPTIGATGLLLDLEYQFQMYEDFRSASTGTIAVATTSDDFTEAWTTAATGTYVNLAGTMNGIIRITGDGAGGAAALSWAMTQLPVFASQSPVFKCRWAQKGTGAGNRFIGITISQLSADTNQGWYFRHAAAGAITAVCRSAGTDVATLSTGVNAANGTYHEGRLVMNGTTSIDVYLDRVFIGTFATGGLIVASAMGLSAGTAATAVADGVDVDYMSITQKRL